MNSTMSGLVYIVLVGLAAVVVDRTAVDAEVVDQTVVG